jgi:flavin reductase (DIM6/NTAB) family NADH-FMN oxidoreductase RutF
MSSSTVAAAGQRRGRRASVTGYLDAMSALASGVVVVTCRIDGRPWGTTVTAFSSVSADPPTVLVSLGSGTAAARAIDHSGSFGVSILAEEQAQVARHCSRPGADKYLERFAAVGASAASPAVAGALAHLDCDVIDRIPVADHLLFVGEVRTARPLAGERAPLVYQGRTYRRLAGTRLSS